MAQPQVVVMKLASVELVDHDHGHWCNRCMLSTGARAFILLSFAHGSTILQTVVWCRECDSRDVEVNPDAHHC